MSADAFSCAHTDVIVRFQRMSGKEVFYPMGWDDNSLQQDAAFKTISESTCDPSLPREKDFQPPSAPGKHPVPVSRPSFVELCTRLTIEDEKIFEDIWRRLGLSVDWAMTYTTISGARHRTYQRSFVRLARKGSRTELRPRHCGMSISRLQLPKPNSRTGRSMARSIASDLRGPAGHPRPSRSIQLGPN